MLTTRVVANHNARRQRTLAFSLHTIRCAAAVTQTLRLGTSICLIIQRDTMLTAKAIASLDQLSGGRVLFGSGGGWNAEQMAHHGTVFKTRFQKLGELRERAAKAGRDMQTISVSVFGAAADHQQLDTYRAAGVTRTILGVPQPAGRDMVLPLLIGTHRCCGDGRGARKNTESRHGCKRTNRVRTDSVGEAIP